MEGIFGRVRERLIAEGWDATVPAVLIERGTGPFEKRVSAPLNEIVEAGTAAGIDSPVLMAVGLLLTIATPAHSARVYFCRVDDPLPWRHLGDLLHWPVSVGRSLTAGRPSEHDVLLVSSAAEVDVGRNAILMMPGLAPWSGS